MRGLRRALRTVAFGCLLGVVPGLGQGDSLAGKDQADRRLVREFLGQTRSALEAGDTAAAQAWLDSLLATDPGNQDAPYLGARLHLASADTTAAETILAEGMVRAPLSGRLKLLSARILLARGRTAEAAELVAGVLAVKPGDPEARYLQGAIALADADTTGALDFWEQALKTELEGGP